MIVRYAKPPIFEEEYRMSDVEGVSTFHYRIRGYKGHEITVSAPPARVYDVSFFFGRLGQDGIWQLVNKAPLPDADARYTIYVKQLADYQHGDGPSPSRSAILGDQSRATVRDRPLERRPERPVAHRKHAGRRSALRADRGPISRLRSGRVPAERRGRAGAHSGHARLTVRRRLAIRAVVALALLAALAIGLQGRRKPEQPALR